MITVRLSRMVPPAFGVLFASFFMAAAQPGGFYLRVERPGAAYRDAALIVRTDGCQQPSKAKISATAEGLVDGQRRSVPLRLAMLDEGVYAVAQQWPAEGTWVLALTGTYRGHVSSVLVAWGPDGQVAIQAGGEMEVRTLPRALTDADVESALQQRTQRPSPASRAGASGD